MSAGKETPADVSAEVAAMQPAWELISCLMGGTDAMRAAGKKLLPKAPAESEAAYEDRRKVSTLYDAYRHTVETMASRPFTEAIKLGEDIPAALLPFLDDVDLEGRDLQAFARDAFQAALADGITYVLAEYPRTSDVKTRADEKAVGARPYLVHINARNVLGWRAERIAGVMTLTMLRLSEQITEPAGIWGTRVVAQVRVLERERWSTWRKNDKGDWVLFDQGPVTIGCIPVAVIYTGRTGFMTACPPLLPLAHLNVEHWQSASDQQNILHVARVPILFASGFGEDALVIGAGAAVSNDDPASKLMYVEHTGAAISAGRESMLDLEKRMAALGAELLLSDSAAAAQTATKTNSDVSQQTSKLAAIVNDLEDALGFALGYMALWAGLGEDGGSVELEGDFTNIDPLDVQSLVAAKGAGILSAQTIFEEFQRLDMIDEDLTWQDEQARLATDRIIAQQQALDTAIATAVTKPGPASGASGSAPAGGGTSASSAPAAPAPDFGPLIDSIGALVKQLGEPPPELVTDAPQVDFSKFASVFADAIKSIPAPVVNIPAAPEQKDDGALVAAVMAMADAMKNGPAPVINVSPPSVTVEAPAAPTITMPPINVTIQKSTGEVTFTEDAKGNVTGAKLQ